MQSVRGAPSCRSWSDEEVRRTARTPRMTRLGLVGGLGPESTIDYYRRILDKWKAIDPTTSPSIVIDSLDVKRALDLVAQDREKLTKYLLTSIQRLADAGADFV